ncbi:MAG: hypothetical protein V4617_02775 [Gemmatimonadota bacterium]
MRHLQRATLTASIAILSAGVARAQAPQDGLVAYPNVYKVQFENAYVRLIRVRLPGDANLGDHTHPAGIMLHVYFNDADPVQFNHDGPPNDVTRPHVRARSYRVGRATPETHSVINTGAGTSDYMRVELKTEGDEGLLRRIPVIPLVDSTATVVDMNNTQYRSSRVTVASGQSIELTASASQPFLLIALTDAITVTRTGSPPVTLVTGGEHFVDAAQSTVVRNASAGPVQLLRVDFLTKPLR